MPPLRRRYDALGCRPGFAVTGQLHVPGGVVQRFQTGALYRNSRRERTFWIYGRVYRTYRQRAEWRSALGFPRSDVRRRGDVRIAEFEGGVVRCRDGSRCVVRR